MKKYKVLERHIGEDPYKPYIPGSEETGTRSLPATDAKALIDLGLLGEIDDDDSVQQTEDQGSDQAGEVADLRRQLEDQGVVLQTRLEEIGTLEQRLADTNGALAKAQAELTELQQGQSDLQAKFDAVTSDLAKANEVNADLTKQIEASASKPSAKAGAKGAEKPASSE